MSGEAAVKRTFERLAGNRKNHDMSREEETEGSEEIKKEELKAHMS